MASRSAKQRAGIHQDNDVLEHAVGLLAWSGHLISDVTLMGTTFSAVVDVDLGAHQWRLENGCSFAVTDPETLTMWEWPEARGYFPPSALTLVGVAVRVDSRWSEGLETARQWRGFAPSSVIYDRPAPPTIVLECVYCGVAMIEVDESGQTNLVYSGREHHLGSAPRRDTSVRWVEESLYARILADGVLGDVLL